MSAPEILSVAEMYTADQAAMAAGTSGESLMEAAGAGVAGAVASRWPVGRVAILCGPGNNGGDGFVAARYLGEAGWDVSVALLGQRDALKGDAAVMAQRWTGDVEALSAQSAVGADVVVDAVFGAGLARPVEGVVAETIDAVSRAGTPVVAVDVPSGLHGDSGQVLGTALKADATVTFFRRKPGHLLYPGRELCGDLEVVDIGIPHAVLADIGPNTWENDPALWLEHIPVRDMTGHKYQSGHAVVASGNAASSGAAHLGALAALRVGAGLVTLACPADAVPVHAARTSAIMTAVCDTPDEFAEFLPKRRHNAVLLGPGNGVTSATRQNVLASLQSGLACVLDADALTVFEDNPGELFAAIPASCVLTPHSGEFARLFGDEDEAVQGKLVRCRVAAQVSGAVVVFKGADTVVAAPDGQAVINTNAPPALATAGSGDVLGGVVTGLMAKGMAPFEAACAGVWLHGEAGRTLGVGLIADDLPEAVPKILGALTPSA